MQAKISAYNDIIHKVSLFYKGLGFDRYENKKGRKLALTIETSLALGIFKQTHGIETKKAVYLIFKPPCSYKTFVVNLNRFAHLAAMILICLLQFNQSIAHVVKYTDSTDIPVCCFKNANDHKTMKGVASFSSCGHGVFYGLRLHLTVDFNRHILSIMLTTAKTDERDVFMKLNAGLRGIFIGDNGYLRPALQRSVYELGESVMLVKPRKNMKKLMTKFEQWLYDGRMKIELNFRNLKLFYGLVTSLPRSVEGYLANYIYSLLACMMA